MCSTPPHPHPPRWRSWFPCHIGGHPSSTPEHSTHTPASLHRGVCDSRANPRTQLDQLWHRPSTKGYLAFLLPDSGYVRSMEGAALGNIRTSFLSIPVDLGPGEVGWAWGVAAGA